MNKPAKSQKATVGSKKAFWKVYELRTRYEVHKFFLKMQVKIFNIPISDDGQALEEMNKFLRSHKVIELQQTLINNDHGAVWCFCARYIQNSPPQNPTFEKQKADYKNLLDEKTFQTLTPKKFRYKRKKSVIKLVITLFLYIFAHT